MWNDIFLSSTVLHCSLLSMIAVINTVVWKLFDRKYFIDNQGKIFSWIHDFLEIFLP